MGIRIDPVVGEVARDGQVWPLSLDCRDGAAVVLVDGTAHRIRPLRWREKQLLARVVRFGPELVERQRLDIALDAPAGAPTLDPVLAGVLGAVASWLDDPDGLPLQREALALATVEVCRATSLRPADLDDRDASEVEALWRTLARHRIEHDGSATPPPSPIDPWADATMIVFDQPPVPPAPGQGPGPAAAVSAAPGAAVAGGPGWHATGPRTSPGNQPLLPPLRPPAPRRARRPTSPEPDPTLVGSSSPACSATQGAAGAPLPDRPAARAPLLQPTAIVVHEGAMTGVAPEGLAEPRASGAVAPARAGGGPRPSSATSRHTVGLVGHLDPMHPPDHARRMDRASLAIGSNGARERLRDERRAPAVGSASGVDALVDELVERLEQSAADLGIEV